MNKKEQPQAQVKPNEEVQPEKEVKVKEEPKQMQESVAPVNVVEDTGINLVPVMSKEEVKDEEKKKKVNVTSLISVPLLFSISILVVGFNIASKIQLNTEREKLYAKEEEMGLYKQYLIDNNDILDRIFLYKDIQEGRFSTKEVVEYIQDIAKRGGNSNVSEISFSGTTAFEFSGRARDLEGVAKLWYLLVNDERIENVDLKSVSKSDEGTRFVFSADLKISSFENLTE